MTTQARWIEKQLKAGRCPRCGNARDDPTLKRLCRTCQDKKNVNARENRREE